MFPLNQKQRLKTHEVLTWHLVREDALKAGASQGTPGSAPFPSVITSTRFFLQSFRMQGESLQADVFKVQTGERALLSPVQASNTRFHTRVHSTRPPEQRSHTARTPPSGGSCSHGPGCQESPEQAGAPVTVPPIPGSGALLMSSGMTGTSDSGQHAGAPVLTPSLSLENSCFSTVRGNTNSARQPTSVRLEAQKHGWLRP